VCSLSQHWLSFQQVLLDLPEATFPAGLTPLHQRFMWLLDLVPIRKLVPSRFEARQGRPPHDRRALLRAFLAKALFNFPTTEALVERLQVDGTLRRLCGWERRSEVPSPATFSRAFAEFAAAQLLDAVHAALVAEHLDGVLVFHVSRDSTAIEAREKVVPKEPPKPKPPKKRGGPKKSEPKRERPLTRIERQAMAPLTATEALLAELPIACAVGSKRDSKGNVMHWRGYKLHADVGDDGIPLLCLTTSASLHDSQAAIPMARKTTSRVTYLYELMDAAYAADELEAAIRDLGHVPIIDTNPGRAGKAAKVPMEPDRARRYRCRSGSERFNALLKDGHGGRTVRVRGQPKVHTHLMLGVVVIFTAILQGWATGGR
jgi:hypothetical protein